MKKIIKLAMALILVLGVSMLGVSAADETVLDISTLADLTETKADPNGAWEYIYDDTEYDEDDDYYYGDRYQLRVYKDIVLTGENSDITIAPMKDVTITLRNATIGTEDALCYDCSDYDVFCGDWESEVNIILEGENTIVSNYYVFYTCDYIIDGEGTLDIVFPEDAEDDEDVKMCSLTIEGGEINIGGSVNLVDVEINGGKVTVEGDLYISAGKSYEFIVNGGELSVGGALSVNGHDGYGLTVNGGVVSADGYMFVDACDGYGVTVNGGVLKTTVLYAMGWTDDYDDDEDLDLEVDPEDIVYDTVEINGGEVILLGGDIGDDYPYPGLMVSGRLTINGGCLKSAATEFPESLREEMGYPALTSIVAKEITLGEGVVLVEGEGPEEANYGHVCISGEAHICLANTITVKAENGEVKAPESAIHGEKVVLEVKAKEGYELESITVNGKKIEGTSFEMPDEDVTIVATFKLKNPPTGDMNITFMVALMAVALTTCFGIRKIKSI